MFSIQIDNRQYTFVIDERQKKECHCVTFIRKCQAYLLLCLGVDHVLEFSSSIITISNRKSYEGSTLCTHRHTYTVKERAIDNRRKWKKKREKTLLFFLLLRTYFRLFVLFFLLYLLWSLPPPLLSSPLYIHSSSFYTYAQVQRLAYTFEWMTQHRFHVCSSIVTCCRAIIWALLIDNDNDRILSSLILFKQTTMKI